MRKLSCKLINWLIQLEAVSEEERELYEYAAYSLLITTSPLMLAVLFGSFMGHLIESIVLIVPFMMLRKFSGGYHMNNAVTCFLTSCFILIGCIILSDQLKYDLKIVIAVLLSAISLSVCSPIDSQNRRLEQEEKMRYKKTTCILTWVFVLSVFVLAHIEQYTLAVCVSIGIVLTSVLQLPCIFKYIKYKSTKKVKKMSFHV